MKFNELSLSEEMQQAIGDLGYEDASPIQAQAIPFIMDGRDVIGQAQTGTGKTAAFGIPLLEGIDPSNKTIQALVMCPTRELALQVSTEFKKLAKYKKGVNIAAIYGGESIERQISELKRGIQIVIGTPGRIMDHLERKTLKFGSVGVVVLDEADEMLNMGFREDIETILDTIPDERQTIFFSATMAKPIMALTKKYQTNPEIVKITRDELTVSGIEQLYYEVRGSAKMDVMTRLIDLHSLKLSVVFCNTKKKVDEVVEQLIANGYKAEGIHGDLRQNQRNNVMGKFRSGHVNILVATDVAARGIDVDNVEAVFNYDLPLDDEYYVHRIGRTGRAGKTGKAFTLVSGKDSSRLREIQHYTKVRMVRGVLPTNEEMAEHRKIKLITKIKTILETKNVQQFETMLDDIEKEGLDLKKVSAALLFMEIGEKEIVRTENKFASEGREGRGDRDSSRGSFGRDRDRNSRGDRNDRGDRGDRFGDRNDKPKREKRSRISNAEMVRLFINVGKMDKVGPGDIVGAIAGETGIAGDSIGSIDIYDKYSFVEIPKESLNEVLEGMNDNTIKGRKVSIEVAN